MNQGWPRGWGHKGVLVTECNFPPFPQDPHRGPLPYIEVLYFLYKYNLELK